jgi:transcriptional regulator with XRE-family HTH domain
LLSSADVEPAPGKVIRSLRQALDMSQAEFARAAGWSPSTISAWERGTSRPSRLAFKTILAFAEERGVRYQPKSAAPALPMNTLPVLRLSSRLPAPPAVELVAPEPPPRGPRPRAESFGSRRWTDMAASGVAGTYDAHAGTRRHHAAWQAEATLHVKIGTGARPSARLGYVVAAAAALVIGLGAGAILRRTPSVDAAARHIASARPDDDAPAATAELGAADEAIDTGDAAANGPESAVASAADAGEDPFPSGVPDPAAAAAAMAPVPAPVALLARLESIVALDGVRRASFRVGDRSIALVEGDQLGARAIAKIANEDVTLVGGGDGPQRVPLGFETPVE